MAPNTAATLAAKTWNANEWRTVPPLIRAPICGAESGQRVWRQDGALALQKGGGVFTEPEGQQNHVRVRGVGLMRRQVATCFRIAALCVLRHPGRWAIGARMAGAPGARLADGSSREETGARTGGRAPILRQNACRMRRGGTQREANGGRTTNAAFLREGLRSRARRRLRVTPLSRRWQPQGARHGAEAGASCGSRR